MSEHPDKTKTLGDATYGIADGKFFVLGRHEEMAVLKRISILDGCDVETGEPYEVFSRAKDALDREDLAKLVNTMRLSLSEGEDLLDRYSTIKTEYLHAPEGKQEAILTEYLSHKISSMKKRWEGEATRARTVVYNDWL